MLLMLLSGFALIIWGLILLFRHGLHERAGSKSATGHYALAVGICFMSGVVVGANIVFAGVTAILTILWIVHRLYRKQNRPYVLTMGQELFPVFMALWIVRSFVIEPYIVPTSSMRPGLIPGDYIIAMKSIWGVRNPISNETIIPVRSPERGDLAVFRYPLDIRDTYVKRIIGLPGDVVTYRDQNLFLNGQKVSKNRAGDLTYQLDDDPKIVTLPMWYQHLGQHDFKMLEDQSRQMVIPTSVMDFAFRDNCQMAAQAFECKVPDGHFFVMGDNRHFSEDSRYWGFLPEKLLVGKPFYLWFNPGAFGRLGPL